MVTPNKKYWSQRFEDLEAKQFDNANDYIKAAEEVYRRAYDDIEKDIAVWFQRLARNNEISISEAKKLLDANELKDFKLTIKDYIKKGKENAIDGRWAKQLENASARVHITRLQMIQLQIRNSLEIWSANNIESFEQFIIDQYSNSLYKTAYDVAIGTGTAVAFSAIDRLQLEKLIRKPWAADGYTFSTRIWRDRDLLVNNLYIELTRSLTRGEGPEKTVTALKKAINSDNSRYQIRRVVYTESSFFSSAGQRDAYENIGVEKYQILVTLDTKTSNICRSFSNRIFPTSEYVPGVTANPFHPFCRTTTIPYFEDSAEVLRYARDENGKGILIPANTSYEDWYKQYVK